MAEAGDARERIWAVAQEEFAAKGLAGARVDEIARRAAVNKAMIYYYFKSKENLLRLIISDFFGELLKLKASLHDGGCMQDESYRRYVFGKIYDFLRQRKSVIRIILREMARGEAEAEEIIFLLGPLSDLIAERLSEMGFRVGPGKAKIIIQSIFFGLVPLLMYVMIEEKLAGYLGTDTEKMLAGFHEEFSCVFDNFRDKLPGGPRTVRRPAG